jgi:hypothetical protein
MSQANEMKELLPLLQQIYENEHKNKNLTDKTLGETQRLNENALKLLRLIKDIEELVSGVDQPLLNSQIRLDDPSTAQFFTLHQDAQNLAC